MEPDKPEQGNAQHAPRQEHGQADGGGCGADEEDEDPMNCPICGMPVWTSKSEPVALCKRLYKRSIKCDTCTDGKTLVVYSTNHVSDRELARQLQEVVPPIRRAIPGTEGNGAGNFFQL